MQVNQQVIGQYCAGIPFRGVITEKRSLTVKTDGCCEYMIHLEAPIEVFGEQRNKVCLYARFDGQPSSYTKHTDWIKAA